MSVQGECQQEAQDAHKVAQEMSAKGCFFAQ